MIKADQKRGVWSAAPTPFTSDGRVDERSVGRMIEHHLRLGVRGLFLAGTNGEGPWLPERDLRSLLRSAVGQNRGRLVIAVQVTANSAAQILENSGKAAEDGADMAVIAPPFFAAGYASEKDRADRLARIYLEAIRSNPLPVGIYDRGSFSSVAIPDRVLERLYGEKNVIMVKDSSSNDAHMALALKAKHSRQGLALLDGYEFDCVRYLKAGYDGLLLGGGVFNGFIARRIWEAAMAGDYSRAERLQKKMNRIMYAVYGGKKIRAWLSGEKYLLVKMGIFGTWRNYPDYPLTAADRRRIESILEKESEWLLP